MYWLLLWCSGLIKVNVIATGFLHCKIKLVICNSFRSKYYPFRAADWVAAENQLISTIRKLVRKSVLKHWIYLREIKVAIGTEIKRRFLCSDSIV